jgi:maltose O-acetyltransferase
MSMGSIVRPPLPRLPTRKSVTQGAIGRMAGSPFSFGELGTNVTIKANFYCESGENIYLGNNVFINEGCHFGDIDIIIVDDFTLIGPRVQIYTGYHDKGANAHKMTLSKPVHIGAHCWIGGAAIILPGVTIGDNATVGAGSVVTKDVPANTTVVGNPARALRRKS